MFGGGDAVSPVSGGSFPEKPDRPRGHLISFTATNEKNPNPEDDFQHFVLEILDFFLFGIDIGKSL